MPLFKTSGDLAKISQSLLMTRNNVLIFKIPKSTSNMFSFIPRSDHVRRKRIFAPAYSHSSMHSPRMQHILATRIAKFSRFLLNQTITSSSNDSGRLIPRNLFRALGVDILTAFAFSDADGTNVMDELQTGANTMEEIGIGIWEPWHEDKRGSFHFFESQPEFKYLCSVFAPHGRDVHVRFEAWVASIMGQYESRLSLPLQIANEEKGNPEKGVYWRLLTYRCPNSGQPLSWRERASEIMDHMGTCEILSISIPASTLCIHLLTHSSNFENFLMLVQEPAMILSHVPSSF